MRKSFSITLIMLGLVGALAYYSFFNAPMNKTIVWDKNGNIVEPVSKDFNNFGH